MRAELGRRIRLLTAATVLAAAPAACRDTTPIDCRRFKATPIELKVKQVIKVHKGPVELTGPASTDEPSLKLRKSPAVPEDHIDFYPCNNVARSLGVGESLTVSDPQVVNGRNGDETDWLTFRHGEKTVFVSTNAGENYLKGYSSTNQGTFRVEKVQDGVAVEAREITPPITVGVVRSK